VTVSDLVDHPSNPHSLVFFLRVPVRTMGDIVSTTGVKDCSWEVELEFEFDLLTDDALSIVSEMKECEELSQVLYIYIYIHIYVYIHTYICIYDYSDDNNIDDEDIDLLIDDALSIVSEMKECEELSQVPMMMIRMLMMIVILMIMIMIIVMMIILMILILMMMMPCLLCLR
jgi:hypothetical protein